MNVTYNSYRDAFGKVVKNKAPYAGALDDMQKATVDDMKKTGFAVTGCPMAGLASLSGPGGDASPQPSYPLH